MNTKTWMLCGFWVALMSAQTSGCDPQNTDHNPEQQQSDSGLPPVTYPEPEDSVDAGSQDSGADGNNDEPDHEFGTPPPPTQDYILDAETATSKTTGLIWLRATLDSSQFCKFTCQDLTAAGRDDWRAPTLAELKTILVNRSTCPRIDEDAFPLTPCSWFTSIDAPENSSDYALLSFYSGEVKSIEQVQKEMGYYCRCVH